MKTIAKIGVLFSLLCLLNNANFTIYSSLNITASLSSEGTINYPIRFEDTGSEVIVECINYKAVFDYTGRVKGTLKELYDKAVDPTYDLVRLTGIANKFQCGDEPWYGGSGYQEDTKLVSYAIYPSYNMVEFVSILPKNTDPTQDFVKIRQVYVFETNLIHYWYNITVLSDNTPYEFRLVWEFRGDWIQKLKWYAYQSMATGKEDFGEYVMTGTIFDRNPDGGCADNLACYSNNVTVFLRLGKGFIHSNFYRNPWNGAPFTEINEYNLTPPWVGGLSDHYTGVDYSSDYKTNALVYKAGWTWTDSFEIQIVSNENETTVNSMLKTLASAYTPPL